MSVVVSCRKRRTHGIGQTENSNFHSSGGSSDWRMFFGCGDDMADFPGRKPLEMAVRDRPGMDSEGGKYLDFCRSLRKECMEFEYKLESALEEGWVLQISDRSGAYREEWAIRPGIQKIQCRIPEEMFLKICVFNKNPGAAGQEGEFYIRGIDFS